jgi:protein STE50
VDNDTAKQGWVPAGCLLETLVPVATAVAEANHSSGLNSEPSSPVSNTKNPILPLYIISTSFPGYALMDYKKKGDEELDLFKDDVLRVFKRYNHWSYVRFFFLVLR